MGALHYSNILIVQITIFVRKEGKFALSLRFRIIRNCLCLRGAAINISTSIEYTYVLTVDSERRWLSLALSSNLKLLC